MGWCVCVGGGVSSAGWSGCDFLYEVVWVSVVRCLRGIKLFVID